MEHIFKRIENQFRNLSYLIDYSLYLILNLFKFKKINKEKIKKIAVIELLDLGDLINSTPVLKTLKDNFPDSFISAIIKPNFSKTLDNLDYINEIHEFKDNKTLLNYLKEKHFDLAVLIHPGSIKLSYTLLKAKIPYRIGTGQVGITKGKGYFLTRKKLHLKKKLALEYNLDILNPLKINKNKTLEVKTTKEEDKEIEGLLKTYKIKNSDLLIGLHTIGKQKANRWDNDKFAEIVNFLSKEYKAKIIFTGTDNEINEINDIIKNSKAINLAGKTNLRQLIALVKRLDLYITIDTGPMHIASALNTPIISLIGPGDPTHFRPLSDKSAYIYKNNVCTSCRRQTCVYFKNYECMKSITVDNVKEKIREILR